MKRVEKIVNDVIKDVWLNGKTMSNVPSNEMAIILTDACHDIARRAQREAINSLSGDILMNMRACSTEDGGIEGRISSARVRELKDKLLKEI